MKYKINKEFKTFMYRKLNKLYTITLHLELIFVIL